MPRLLSFMVALASVLAAGSAFAHHPSASLGTIRITQSVMAGGTLLPPGTYEIRDTGEHGTPLPGQSADAQSRVEFVQDGMVVARDLAEVMVDEGRPVGTSGATNGAATRRPRVEPLKGGDFMRVVAYRGNERYLIHLPVAP